MIEEFDPEDGLECILKAQEFLNSGNVTACKQLLTNLKENGIEPVSLIDRAIQNFSRGEKKLLALPAYNKPASPTKATKPTLSKPQLPTASQPVQNEPSLSQCLPCHPSSFDPIPNQATPSQHRPASSKQIPCHKATSQAFLSRQLQSQTQPCEETPQQKPSHTPTSQPLICKPKAMSCQILLSKETSQSKSFKPTPSKPIPSKPTPSQPTPSQPTPSQPTPSQPTPSQPTANMQKRWRKKTFNLGLPSRKKATPKSATKPRIFIKKLEESPMGVNEDSLLSNESDTIQTPLIRTVFADVGHTEDLPQTHQPHQPISSKNNNKDSSHWLTNLLKSAELHKERTYSTTDLLEFNKNTCDNDTTSTGYTILDCHSQMHHNISKDASGLSGILNASNSIIPEKKYSSSNVELENCVQEKKSTKSLSSIFENDQKDVSTSDTRKRSNSDSGCQEVNNSDNSGCQTPMKVMKQDKEIESGIVLSVKGLDKQSFVMPKGGSQYTITKPDFQVKSAEDGPVRFIQPLSVDKENIGDQPHVSFKMPMAPAPRPQNIEQHTRVTDGTRESEQTPLDIRKCGGNFTPKVKDDLSSLATQIRNTATKARNGAHSTTKKNKIIRIKSEKYRVIAVLGKGGSSKVYEVEKEDGSKFALKCVWLEDLDEVMLEAHINEIQILQMLSGKSCIIHLHEWELKNEILHMLIEKGDMDFDKFLRLNKRMKSEQIKKLWKQMLLAVDTIHKQGIIHSDLKPANFLFVGSSLKLIDFGIAKGLQDNCTSTQRDCRIGTLNYMAPEAVSEAVDDRVEGGKKNYKIRRATDIWSLGCILYLMVYGTTPFQHITNGSLKILEITNGKDISFRHIEDGDLLDSLKGCLKRRPGDRYTTDQLLNHPFLTGRPMSYSAEKDGDVDVVMNKSVDEVMNSIKQSTINSPSSLLRISKSLAKRNILSNGEKNPVRKAIF